MTFSPKTWVAIGGTATALALTPLAASAGTDVLSRPMAGSGVVVAAAPAADPAESSAGPVTEPDGAPSLVSPASPTTPSHLDSPATAVSPVSPASPVSAASAASPASPVSPASPR